MRCGLFLLFKVIGVKEHMNDSSVYGSAGAVHDNRARQTEEGLRG